MFVEADILTFLQHIEVGNSVRAAASIAGWSPSLVYNELRTGRGQERKGKSGKARKFLQRYREARAKAESHYVRLVAAGAVGSPGDKERGIPARLPDTADAKFMLKALDPKRWNPEMGGGSGKPTEKPISRLELMGAFAQMGQAVAQEVEDPRARARIGERWREIYRTLGLDEDRVQIKENGKPPLDQKRLPA